MSEEFRMADFKEYKAYLRSEENINSCKPYDQLCQKFASLLEQYGDAYEKLYSEAEAMEYRKEYAKGGEVMHLGYYSPSASDLFVGGCSRGRLLKRTPKGNNYDYEYSFDEAGRMICCKKYWINSKGEFALYSAELFVYEADRVLSLGYWLAFKGGGNNLTSIAEYKYKDGKLIRYERASCDLWRKRMATADEKGVLRQKHRDYISCSEISIETFEYENDLLKTVYWYHYTPSVKILDEHRYTFSRDEEGYLTTYVSEDLSSWARKLHRDEPGTYSVSGKRRR